MEPTGSFLNLPFSEVEAPDAGLLPRPARRQTSVLSHCPRCSSGRRCSVCCGGHSSKDLSLRCAGNGPLSRFQIKLGLPSIVLLHLRHMLFYLLGKKLLKTRRASSLQVLCALQHHAMFRSRQNLGFLFRVSRVGQSFLRPTPGLTGCSGFGEKSLQRVSGCRWVRVMHLHTFLCHS